LISSSNYVLQEGYREVLDGTFVSVFSAANYFYRFGNVGAILELDEHRNKTFKVFSHAQH